MAVGVKETKEAGLGLILLAKKIAIAVKAAKKSDDKIDLSDISELMKLFGDAEIIAALKLAVEGVDLIGEEVKDVNLPEAIELVSAFGMAAYDAVKEVEAA